MRSLLDDLNAFFQDHRRCEQLDSGIAGARVWITCDWGVVLARLISPFERVARRADQEAA